MALCVCAARSCAACRRVTSWIKEARAPSLAISHGLIGRIVRGVYLGLAMPETLALPIPQDVVFQLSDGAVTAVQR
jgi:broad specificity phosphatase PhoE